VCLCERERERERGSRCFSRELFWLTFQVGEKDINLHLFILICSCQAMKGRSSLIKIKELYETRKDIDHGFHDCCKVFVKFHAILQKAAGEKIFIIP
jgi:hypothetical protein